VALRYRGDPCEQDDRQQTRRPSRTNGGDIHHAPRYRNSTASPAFGSIPMKAAETACTGGR
jgi:hypothetical protein